MTIGHDKWYVKDVIKLQKFGKNHNSLSRDYRQGFMMTKDDAIFYSDLFIKEHGANSNYINKDVLERKDKIKEILS